MDNPLHVETPPVTSGFYIRGTAPISYLAETPPIGGATLLFSIGYDF